MEESKKVEQKNDDVNSTENEGLPRINLKTSTPVSVFMTVNGKKVNVNAKPI
jgi:hypothetical protein